MEDATGKGGVRAVVACVLTWLLPGAGHVYIGRSLRGLIFFVLVGSTVVLGVAERGNLSLVNETAPFLTKLQVGVNLALGPSEPVLRKGLYGALVYDRRGRGPEILRFMERRKQRARHPGSSYGTAYLWTAGLMNLLLLLDVYDLATGRKR